MDNEDTLIIRVGMFFYLMGGGAFIIFLASDFAKKADFDYLFTALLLFGVGWFFRRGKPPPKKVARFEWLKKWNDARKQKSAEKLKKKPDAKKK
jgi:hypothetical protein